MNRENLRSLIQNYISNFELINDDKNEEYYKWVAVKHFHDNWDISAGNFAEMFKESVKLTYNLINNHIVQPTSGIVKLAEREELTDKVRGAFTELFEDDDNDIDARQDKIYAFIETINKLLDEYEPGRWKYTQDMRTVIFYLSLMYPEKNYMFKATQAKEFMYCIEYGDDFGSGESFSLKKYYNMCDLLVEEIKNTPELISLHESRLTDTMYTDDDYHILAYDIIYSGIVYNLYSNITIVKPSKVGNDEYKKMTRKNEILAQLEADKTELNEVINQRAEFDFFSAVGLEVEHKKFGSGKVVIHDGPIIEVEFSEGIKKFQLPAGFTGGFLKIESEEIMTLFTEMDELDKQIKEKKSKIHIAEIEIERLG